MTTDERVRVLNELLQNAFDAEGVTTVEVHLRHEDRGLWYVDVEDDAPEGFADLSHSYTLYARSTKRDDPTKRGRFNEGEKKVLALARWARLSSTKGTILFADDGTRHFDAKGTKTGSEFGAMLHLTKPQGEAALQLLRQAIPPAGITTTINGVVLDHRKPVRVIDMSLPTIVYNDEGEAVERTRHTTVELYDPAEGEVPSVYEMGLPVVEHGDRWHYNVMQRVPLNRERDNVRPTYLRKLRTAVVNRTVDLLSSDDTTSTFVKEALGSPDIDPAAVAQVVTKRFGDKVVAFDPSDPEANQLAASQGYTVVHGRSLSRDEWANVREAGAILPAGKVTPSPRVDFSANGTPPIAESDWTPGMRWVAHYCSKLGAELLGAPVSVAIYQDLPSAIAAYRPGHLTLSLRGLGHRWFDEPDVERIDQLMIHEFGHHWQKNHLSSEYHEELCRLGAKLRTCRTSL